MAEVKPAIASDEEQALDQLLAREPRNIQALVRKGDLRSKAGDGRGAAELYRAALKIASTSGPLPSSLRPSIERAQAGMARAAQSFERHLESHLARAGFGRGSRPPRFDQSIDLMTGRRQAQLQLQRPTSYYMPGLPQRRYYERAEFSWAKEVEQAAEAMREELAALLAGGADPFSPYIVSDPLRQRQDLHGLVDNLDWSTLYLFEKGRPVEEQVARCPRTFAAVKDLDLPHITVRAPSILFSRLRAGARIPPHTGMLNTRLICHLPLIVPPGGGFRVGGETRPWRVGELLTFDDTVEHEAWNEGASDRVILIFDIWRPELSQEERRAVTALFEAVDAYGL